MPRPTSRAPAPPPPRIVLASGSPRRRMLLEGLGLRFAVHPADIDESMAPGEEPARYANRLAWAKAREVDRRLAVGSAGARGAATTGALVIAADTVVAVDGAVLGKPADRAENRAFLDLLSGRTHRVSTGHCLLLDGRVERVVRTTDVTFRELDPDERDRYAATGEGADKAGGYAIQGIGASLVERSDGCYFTVVGLSLSTVVTAARRLGVALV